MDPVLLVGQYPYSYWVLCARPGGIESYRPLPQLGVPPCDRGKLGGSPWLLRFVTIARISPTKYTVAGPGDQMRQNALTHIPSRG